MKASVTIKVYTKGESKNAIVKTITSCRPYVVALDVAENAAKVLSLTGWFTDRNIDALTHFDFERGVKFENYTNEVLILTLKSTKK